MNHEFTFDCESFGSKLGMLSWFLVTKLEMRVVVEYLAPLSEILVWLYLCTTLYRVSVTRLHSLSDKLLLPLTPPLPNVSKPKIYPNKSWRFLDGRVVIVSAQRVVIVSAQRVLESQIFTVSFHCINLPFAVQDLWPLLILFMFLAADWTVLFFFRGSHKTKR